MSPPPEGFKVITIIIHECAAFLVKRQEPLT